MKCNETQGKWCKNKHGASKIIDTFETYQSPKISALFMILHLNTKCTQMGSSSLATLRITQNKFNKIKWNHKSQGRQWELKQIHFLARDKVFKSNSQCEDDK
jgi:hypothetical protein